MARLGPLLHYARVSRKRSFALKRSGMAKGAELCIVALLLLAYYRQLKLVMTGPPFLRFPAAEWMVFVLAALWILLPISISLSIPAPLLTTYPLSRSQRIGYLLLSHWLEWKAFALLAASVVGIVAVASTPRPWMHMAQAVCVVVAGCVGGTALALGSAALQSYSVTSGQRPQAWKSRKFPLFWKELVYFSRTLDPYVAFLIAIAAGYTEVIASWMTPAKATLPLLLIVVIQLPSVLNPFGLDSSSEMVRYRFIPVAFARILANKHAAIATFIFLSASPLLGTLLFRMPWRQSLFAISQFALILTSFLLTGLVLMRTQSAQNIKMRFGGLAGDGLTLELFAVAVTMCSFLPLAVLFVARDSSAVLRAATSVGVLVGLGMLYFWLLQRQKWPS